MGTGLEQWVWTKNAQLTFIEGGAKLDLLFDIDL